jgi:hypothetical protein
MSNDSRNISVGQGYIKGAEARRKLVAELRDSIKIRETRQRPVPSPEDMEEMKTMNSFLMELILIWAGVTAVSSLLLVIPRVLNDVRSLWTLPLVLMWPGLAIWIAMRLRRYDGAFYGATGWLCVVGILKTFEGHGGQFTGLSAWIYFPCVIVLLVTASIISFSIKKRFFPHILWNGVKRTGDRYILGRRDTGRREGPWRLQ